MTGILLDTSAYSAARRGHVGLAESIREADVVALNAVVVGELLAGFGAGARLRENEADLKRFLSSPRAALLAVDGATADRYAAIASTLKRAGRPIPTNDLWIAASAMQHGLALATTDAHFLRVPQILVRHFEVP